MSAAPRYDSHPYALSPARRLMRELIDRIRLRLKRLSQVGPPVSLMIPGGIALGCWALFLHRDHVSLLDQVYVGVGLVVWCSAMVGPTLLRAWLDRKSDDQ